MDYRSTNHGSQTKNKALKNQIGFAYANNIWVVPRAGGSARRITSFQGQTGNPHFSPDGKWIAFSGEYAGNLDVYIVSSEGAEPRRLTWHPGSDTVEGWTPDGKSILFSSTRATWAPSGAPRFWTVGVSGGVEEPGKRTAGGTLGREKLLVICHLTFFICHLGIVFVWSFEMGIEKCQLIYDQ